MSPPPLALYQMRIIKMKYFSFLKFEVKIRVSSDSFTAQKMKFSIKDFFSKCDQICRKLRIRSHLLNIYKKSLMESLVFCAVRISMLVLNNIYCNVDFFRLSVLGYSEPLSDKCMSMPLNSESFSQSLKERLVSFSHTVISNACSSSAQ